MVSPFLITHIAMITMIMRIMRMSIILKLSGRTGVKGEMKFIKRKVPPGYHYIE